ncbi:MAG: hypothetical protein HY817_02110 [Candidatus Abawacabacteria bacterium]|nr:hypothetical protein [Candidatus Abawacabacteria bacterium]
MKQWVLDFLPVNRTEFIAIQSGIKKIEVRACAPKYALIAAGDEIIFTVEDDIFVKKVATVKRFVSLEAMFAGISYQEIQPYAPSLPAAIEKYATFPQYPEKIARYGLIAIYLE